MVRAGLSRIHVGLESGDDLTLKSIKKGTTCRQQINTGKGVVSAGIELSIYIILGIGGKKWSIVHTQETARVVNAIGPDFIRLRPFVPEINTPLLKEILDGSFTMLSPYEILGETVVLIKGIDICTYLPVIITQTISILKDSFRRR